MTGQQSAVTTNYVTAIDYAVHGAPSKLTLAAGTRWEQHCYNDRLQVTGLFLRTQSTTCPATGSGYLAKLNFDYGTASNNGNVASQTINDGGSFTVTQSYQYDALNRLQSASEPGTASWQETFDHDRWGNRWVVSGSTSGVVVSGLTPTASTWFTPKNRLNLANGNFDRAGNQLKVNPFTLTYDAENRQTAAASVSNGSADVRL